MSNLSTLWNSAYFELPQLSWNCTPPAGFSSTHNVWMLDNVMTRQPNGDCGLVTIYGGVAGLAYYMGDPSPLAPRFYGNVMYVPSGDRLQSFPAHNYSTMVSFSYVDPAHTNYQLASPNWTDTTDGKIAGINWSTLQAATGYSAAGNTPPLGAAVLSSTNTTVKR
jgi:hypothetical protein